MQWRNNLAGGPWTFSAWGPLPIMYVCMDGCSLYVTEHVAYIAPLQDIYLQALYALDYYDVKCNYERIYYIS